VTPSRYQNVGCAKFQNVGCAKDEFVAHEELNSDSKNARKRAKKLERRAAHKLANTHQLRQLQRMLEDIMSIIPSLAGSLAPALARTSNDAALAPLSIDIIVASEMRNAEAALEAVASVLRTEHSYRSLTMTCSLPESVEVLGSMVVRSPKYQEKHLIQEMSLLAKVWAFARAADEGCADGLAVVDVGAYAGHLALMAAILLGAHVVLVDRRLPPKEFRVEENVPEPYRGRIVRIIADIAELGPRDVELLLMRRGVSRVVVVAKHLCGLGTDLALAFMRRWSDGARVGSRWLQACGCNVYEVVSGVEGSGNNEGNERSSSGVTLLGAVIATCCAGKIREVDYDSFAEVHAGDMHLNSFTHQHPARMRSLLALCARYSAWRTATSKIIDLQVRAAELLEDVLQQPRLNLLRRVFPAATEVAFVPVQCSPQNRCLLAGSVEGLRWAQIAAGDTAFLKALQAVRQEVLIVTGGQPLHLPTASCELQHS